jgi:hypothetical protein
VSIKSFQYLSYWIWTILVAIISLSNETQTSLKLKCCFIEVRISWIVAVTSEPFEALPFAEVLLDQKLIKLLHINPDES